MGTYTDFLVDGYSVSSTKGYAEDELLALFQESDKRVRPVVIDSLGWEYAGPWMTWAEATEWLASLREIKTAPELPGNVKWELVHPDDERSEFLDGEATPDDSETGPYGEIRRLQFDQVYRAPAWVIADRLEAIGYTLSSVRALFESGMSGILAELERQATDPNRIPNSRYDELGVVRLLTFDVWLQVFRDVVKTGTRRIEYNAIVPRDFLLSGYYLHADEASPQVRYVLDEDDPYRPFGFPTEDSRVLVRGAIAACAPDDIVEQDLSAVTHSGYYEIDGKAADAARAALLANHPANAPIIVLTEGASDRDVLSRGLQLLYPHLSHLYTFMDFDGMNVMGGAAALIASVKAFSAAKITNRIVALLDNDTAARSALRGLSGLTLPPNVRVLQFPEIDIGRAYPTLGPSGEALMDINGMAGALELYLGNDVLRRPDGTLVPVHWRSFEKAVGAFQGELLEKHQVQQRFQDKLRAAEQDGNLVAKQDWTGLRIILDVLRTAFS